MYRRFLFCFALIGMLLCSASATWAQLDPLGANPPVFQTLGMVDTEFHLLQDAGNCTICHDDGVPDRHHVLYGQTVPSGSIVPYPGNATYTCTSCHGTTFPFVAERNCTVCHGEEGSPHHTGSDAVNRQCNECHGDLVANFDDGHYIPTYAASLVTPYTGLHGEGRNADGTPYQETDGGSGEVVDTELLTSLESGFVFTWGETLTRTDPTKLRFLLPGLENDFSIAARVRSGNTINVVFLQGTLGAVWDAGTSTLVVTVAPSQTAEELIAAITLAEPTQRGVVAEKLLTDGSLETIPEHDIAPLGDISHPNNRGFGAGSCSYCHDHDGNLDANGDLAPVLIVGNYEAHHHIDLSNNVLHDPAFDRAKSLADTAPAGQWRKCNICHDYQGGGGTYHDQSGPGFDLHIRVCEECHSVDSLHSIQADSNGDGDIVVGGELAGYGHVGRDGGAGDSDCWGCHGFGFKTASAPVTGPVVATLYNVDTAAVSSGQEALVLLSGAAFTNVSNGESYESDVRLTAADGTSVTLEPELILDQGQLAVTIPATTTPGNYKVQAIKDDMASNPAVISVTPQVTVTRAVSTRGLTTIYGSGFGGHVAGSGTTVTGTYRSIVGRRVRIKTMEATITSWTDSKIVVSFPEVPRTATVKSVFGEDTYNMVP